MTRILFMHQTSSIGGGSYCLLNIIKELDKHFFEPIVALQNEGPLADELRKLGIDVVFFCQMAAVPYNQSLLSRGSIGAYMSVGRSMKHFKRLLKRVSCDVLYLNNMMLYPYLRMAKESGIKTVVHVREHWPLNEHTIQLSWARKIVYRYADKMIAINHYSASIFPQKKATIVYDWIDMSNRYKNMPLSEIFGEDMEEKKVLLYTGGFSTIKGAYDIINVFCNKIKGEEYRLLVLGVDDLKPLKGIKHRIKCLLASIGFHYELRELYRLVASDRRIRCIPGVYELNHLVEQSYCFVSYFKMPHANLALAENIILCNACIAADTEESREYSHDGDYAMLVEPNNANVFAVKLKEFLDNIKEWRERAIKGSIPVSQLFDKRRNVDILNSLLKSLQ